MSREMRTVGEVARTAGVTVRTLHHYDDIGLLVPSGRSGAGYRLYGGADLERLHQILLLRELDVPLEAIRGILDDPAYDRRTALRAQRRLLEERLARTASKIRAVEAALDTLEGGREMRPEELFEGFDPALYENEVQERWGGSEAYAESVRRTRRYTDEDWRRMKAEGDELVGALAAHLAAGRSPDEEEVMAAAEAHRLHIDRWFYPCSREMHVALSRMYVDDPRFAATFEAQREGLTEYVAAAIRANAAREGSGKG